MNEKKKITRSVKCLFKGKEIFLVDVMNAMPKSNLICNILTWETMPDGTPQVIKGKYDNRYEVWTTLEGNKLVLRVRAWSYRPESEQVFQINRFKEEDGTEQQYINPAVRLPVNSNFYRNKTKCYKIVVGTKKSYKIIRATYAEQSKTFYDTTGIGVTNVIGWWFIGFMDGACKGTGKFFNKELNEHIDCVKCNGAGYFTIINKDHTDATTTNS